ncbi:MAG: hypothetical protein P9L94_09105 [Candidatus Hinthialibacter antarcticus]|nr:hypothetical protein [Candidatus Hinthialibacter antarcticus]
MKAMKTVGVFGLYLAFAVARTFPWVLRLGDATQEDALDSLLVAWMIGWNHHAFAHGFGGYFNANIFYPHENAFLFSELMLGPALATAPLYGLGFGPLFCLNLFLLIALALNGLAVYLLAKEIGCHAEPAFFGGAAFSMTTYALMALRRPHFLFMFALLFALLFLYRFLEQRRLRWLAAYMVCALFLLTCNMYLAAALVPASGLLLLFSTRKNITWTPLVALGGVVLLLALAYGWQYSLRRSAIVEAGLLGPPDAAQLTISTITFANLVWPSGSNSFYQGRIPIAHLTFAELRFFPGFLVLFLCGIEFASIFRARQNRRRSSALHFMAWCVCSLLMISVVVLSWQKTQTVLYHQIHLLLIAVFFGLALLLPSWRRGIIQWLKTAHPLLASLALFAFFLMIYSSREFSALLFQWAPQLAFIRIPGRFGVVPLLVICLFAAAALHRALSVMQPLMFKRGVVLALLMVLYLETTVSTPLMFVDTPTTKPAVYDWLSQQDDIQVMAEMPMQTHLQNCMAQYRSSFHWKKLVNGYSGYFPYEFATLRDQMKAFPSRESLQALHQRGCDWVVAHKNEMPPLRFAQVAFFAKTAPWIHVAYEDEDSLALQLLPMEGGRAVRIDVGRSDGRASEWRLQSGEVSMPLPVDENGVIELQDMPPGTYSVRQQTAAAPVLRLRFLLSEKTGEQVDFQLVGDQVILIDDAD